RDKDRWLERLGAADPGRVDVCVSALVRHVPLASLPADDDPRRSRGHLKIQDGCDYRCSFCVVPAVRGRSASVEPTRVASQLAELVAAGLPEVVLTGVHLGTYGRDLSPRVDLRGLLVELLPRLGGARLRLGSLDPHEVDDALVELLAAERGRICRHLHLPVQSGDDAVLQRMRRAHRAGDLAALVPRLVQAVPGIAVGSDVIVGFPGEDEAAFERTLELLEGLPVAYLHVFAYSRREGTAAASMPEQVAPEVRARRSQRLRALSTAKAAAFRAAQVGAEAAAVVQRRRDPASGRLVALTDNYVEVLVDGSDALLGHGVVVRIEDAGEAAAPHPRALGRVIDG
ncbi:MAG TPA: MiaB/RimO family radical SAM methylthiotransferase, partial [Nannocystaceae bacterium]|nr:MiaB/RimO family radical SAM methylthiotransferase [Nannocystaceae bacterium]